MSAVKYNRIKLINPKVVTSDTIIEIQACYASDSIPQDDQFGRVLSLNNSDNVLVAGIPFDDTNGTSGGRVLFFTNYISDLWNRYDVANGISAGDFFGTSTCVDSSGAVVLIGAPGAGNGAVYYYKRVASDNWTLQQTKTASDSPGAGNYGSVLCVNGAGTIAVSSQPNINTSTGAVVVLKRNVTSDLWTEIQQFQSSDPTTNDQFGFSMSMNTTGDKLLIGAPFQDAGGSNTGAVYYFTKNASDLWSQKQKIQASDRTADDQYGYNISIDATGNGALIGAPFQDNGGSNAGAVYYITRNTSSDLWSEMQKIQAIDKSAQNQFGFSVSVNGAGDISIVGANTDGLNGTGAVYIFAKNSSDVWFERTKKRSSDIAEGHYFGTKCLTNYAGTKFIAGAPGVDINGGIITSDGAFYTFIYKPFPSTEYCVFSDVAINEVYIEEYTRLLKIK